MRPVVRDSLQVASGVRRQVRRIFLEKDAGKPVDGAQRSPQIVGDGVGEGLQLPVGGFELARSRGDLFDQPDSLEPGSHERRVLLDPHLLIAAEDRGERTAHKDDGSLAPRQPDDDGGAGRLSAEWNCTVGSAWANQRFDVFGVVEGHPLRSQD